MKTVKLNLNTILIIIIAVMLVVYIIFGIAIIKQQHDKESYAAQIDLLSPALQGANADTGTVDTSIMEQKLADAEARLAGAQEAFPSQLNNADIVNSILQIATENQVKVLPIRAQQIQSEKIAQNTYNVIRLEVTASGSLSQLQSFISGLEDGEFKTLCIENSAMTVEDKGVTVVLNLAVYAQPLPSNTTSQTVK